MERMVDPAFRRGSPLERTAKIVAAASTTHHHVAAEDHRSSVGYGQGLCVSGIIHDAAYIPRSAGAVTLPGSRLVLRDNTAAVANATRSIAAVSRATLPAGNGVESMTVSSVGSGIVQTTSIPRDPMATASVATDPAATIPTT